MAGTEADENTSESRAHVRHDHAIRIGETLRKRWQEFGFDSSQQAAVLGEICKGHRPKKDASGTANWSNLSEQAVLGPGKHIRSRLVAAAIFAIDELHVGADRAPERLEAWRKPKSDESLRHWRRHQAIEGPATVVPGILSFQASPATPAAEKDLRLHVLAKAFRSLRDFRNQVQLPGISSVSVTWKRDEIWKLLLPIVCADSVPRSPDEIARIAIERFATDRGDDNALDGLCDEKNTTRDDLFSEASNIVDEYIVQKHLVTNSGSGRYVLSTDPRAVEAFSERARVADDCDRLFSTKYRVTWEEQLFSSPFGRRHVQCTLFPAIADSYLVHLAARKPDDPTRLLIELCPTAARMTSAFPLVAGNLVRESLLSQVALTGAMIDIHRSPEILLNPVIRAAARELSAKNEHVSSDVRFLEELALVSACTSDQVRSEVCDSSTQEDGQSERENAHQDQKKPLSISFSQEISPDAPSTMRIGQLFLASARAKVAIRLTSSVDSPFPVRVVGEGGVEHCNTTGGVVE